MPGFSIGGGGTINPKTIDPLRSYRWNIDKLGPVTTDILAAYELTLPSKSFETLEVLGTSMNYKFAKSVSFDDCMVSFYDISYLQTKIESWMNKVWTLDRGVSVDYKDIVIFSLTDNTGSSVRQYTLHNAWPKKIGHSQLSMASNEFKIITLTLAYDWYELQGSSANKS